MTIRTHKAGLNGIYLVNLFRLEGNIHLTHGPKFSPVLYQCIVNLSQRESYSIGSSPIGLFLSLIAHTLYNEGNLK